ncbi:helix-turn-helix transcriptional regulator [Azospirillum brasilense]|uniref:helix-turn-helix transcriptional regulator n=1 Tax=Azospirillum brasilense TaxID=192 RepID=UPI000E0C1319|nr:AlpA family phage regulatory protein [Azospirillum brasilense]
MRRVLRFKQLSEVVPYTRMHIFRLEKAGKFPTRVQLGPNSVGWFEDEIAAWIDARGAARDSARSVHSGARTVCRQAPGAIDPELAAMLS